MDGYEAHRRYACVTGLIRKRSQHRMSVHQGPMSDSDYFITFLHVTKGTSLVGTITPAHSN
jgi:hypothetical protein